MERTGSRCSAAGTFMDLTDTEEMSISGNGTGVRRNAGRPCRTSCLRIFCKMKSVSGNLRAFHDRASNAKGARLAARFLRVSVGLSQGLRWSRAEARSSRSGRGTALEKPGTGGDGTVKCPDFWGRENQGREEGGRRWGACARSDRSQRNGSVTESPVDSNVSTKDTIIMRISADEESPSFSAAAFSRSLVSVSNRMGMALSFNMARAPYHILAFLTSSGGGRRSSLIRGRKFSNHVHPCRNTVCGESKLANRISL